MTTEAIANPGPARARAVFSTEDFKLLRTAVMSYLQEVQDKPESVKYSNLYHRLGRLSGGA
jgi:predicted Zn-dependent peptidase